MQSAEGARVQSDTKEGTLASVGEGSGAGDLPEVPLKKSGLWGGQRFMGWGEQ